MPLYSNLLRNSGTAPAEHGKGEPSALSGRKPLGTNAVCRHSGGTDVKKLPSAKNGPQNQPEDKRFPLAGKRLPASFFSCRPTGSRAKPMDFCCLRLTESAENIIFIGPFGVGETHLKASIGMEAASARQRARCAWIHCIFE